MLLDFAGHSLGGALATLAAYDVRAVGKKYGKDCKVSCYTCASSPVHVPWLTRGLAQICSAFLSAQAVTTKQVVCVSC